MRDLDVAMARLTLASSVQQVSCALQIEALCKDDHLIRRRHRNAIPITTDARVGERRLEPGECQPFAAIGLNAQSRWRKECSNRVIQANPVFTESEIRAATEACVSLLDGVHQQVPRESSFFPFLFFTQDQMPPISARISAVTKLLFARNQQVRNNQKMYRRNEKLG